MGVYYLSSTVISSGVLNTLLTNAPSSADYSNGWAVAKLGSPNYCILGLDANSTSFVTTEPTSFSQKGYRTSGTLNGDFAAGTWSLAIKVRSNGYYAATGTVKIRLWKSTNADGSSATQLTSGWVASTLVSFTAANQDKTYTITTPSLAAKNFANEYLFVEVEWSVTAAGGHPGTVVSFYDNEGAAEALTTPTYTPGAQTFNLTANISGATATPENVAWTMPTIRNLTASISGATATPDNVVQGQAKSQVVTAYNPGSGTASTGLGSLYTDYSQSFKPETSGKLVRVDHYLQDNGSTAGTIYARIWSHSGTYGVDSVGGTVLATSDPLPYTALPVGSQGWVAFTFSGDQQIQLEAGTPYVVTVYAENWAATTYPYTFYGTSTHLGNYARRDTSGTWDTSNSATRDLDFKVFVESEASFCENFNNGAYIEVAAGITGGAVETLNAGTIAENQLVSGVTGADAAKWGEYCAKYTSAASYTAAPTTQWTLDTAITGDCYIHFDFIETNVAGLQGSGDSPFNCTNTAWNFPLILYTWNDGSISGSFNETNGGGNNEYTLCSAGYLQDNVRVRVDFHMNATTRAYEIKIDGVSKKTGTLASDVTDIKRFSLVGVHAASGVRYLDNLQVGTTNWIASESTTYDLTASISGATATPNIAQTTTHNLTGAVTGATTTPSIARTLVRNLSASVTGATATSSIARTLVRNLSASIAGSTATPNAARTLVRDLTVSITGATTTPSAAGKIIFNLTASIAGQTATPDNVQANMTSSVASKVLHHFRMQGMT